jgi:hypothetical protein
LLSREIVKKKNNIKMFAIALYDNEAESEDELNFKKDDILEIIEFDFEGLEGWWFCKLNNKTGLAAGNRLKILNVKQQQIYNNRNTLRDSNASTISNISTNSKLVSYFIVCFFYGGLDFLVVNSNF